MTIQEITSPSGDTLVILPKADYLALVEAAEDHADIEAVRAYQQKLETGEEDALPIDLAKRILAGESPIRIWREYRGMSVSALAAGAGMSQPYLSQIEQGARNGTAKTLGALAKVLGLSIDDLA